MVYVRKKCGLDRLRALSAVHPNSWLQRFVCVVRSSVLSDGSFWFQILLEQRYGKAVDWWAFGVLTYEMLLGQSPFRGDDEDEIFDAILEDEPLYPITMPKDAVSILQKVRTGPCFYVLHALIFHIKLLTRDPSKRLGSGKADAEEIKRHPFFKDVNWDDVMGKKIPPPYFPQIVRSRVILSQEQVLIICISHRKRLGMSAISIQSSLESSLRSHPFTDNLRRRTKWSSKVSLG